VVDPVCDGRFAAAASTGGHYRHADHDAGADFARLVTIRQNSVITQRITGGGFR
jgi:hypothetical protein